MIFDAPCRFSPLTLHFFHADCAADTLSAFSPLQYFDISPAAALSLCRYDTLEAAPLLTPLSAMLDATPLSDTLRCHAIKKATYFSYADAALFFDYFDALPRITLPCFFFSLIRCLRFADADAAMFHAMATIRFRRFGACCLYFAA